MKSLFAVTAVLTLILGGAFLYLIEPALARPTQPPFGSFVNSSGVPSGSILLLNITYTVTNDEDSGNVGYWALDNYNKQVQVWQTPDGSFYAVARYTGKWQTFAGALSPGFGVPQPQGGSGTFEGGYIANFSGSFTPGTQQTHGYIGTFDYGGTEADVLLGLYADQTGPTTVFHWLSAYFTGVGSSFVQPRWGWTYHYRGQTWNNFSYGTTGDIVI